MDAAKFKDRIEKIPNITTTTLKAGLEQAKDPNRSKHYTEDQRQAFITAVETEIQKRRNAG